MARGINKVILIGNLGQDPDVRYTQSGAAVTNLNLATSDTWNDKQSGQRQERTEWHRVVMFNKLAEVAQQYLRKGSKVYIEGRIQTRKWQGQDGQDRYSTEIVANDMQMLDTRSGQGADSGYAQGASQGSYGSSSQGGGQRSSQGQQASQDKGQQSQQDQGKSGSNNPQQGHNQQSSSQQNNQQGNNYGAPNPGSFDDFDDEIPF